MKQIDTEQIESLLRAAKGESVDFWVIAEGWGPEINMYSGWHDEEYDEFFFKDNDNDLMDGWSGTADLTDLGPVFVSFVEAAGYAAGE